MWERGRVSVGESECGIERVSVGESECGIERVSVE